MAATGPITATGPRLRRRLAAATCCGVVALLGAGCSDDGSSPEGGGAATASYNQADVDFVTGMVPHHAQALAMVRLTGSRDLTPEVRDLASDIRAAQRPEIATMESLLASWDVTLPDGMDHSDMGDMEGMDHAGSADAGGMMSSGEMSSLRRVSDARFEDRWLTMMVEHHRGAVDQARTELSQGRSVRAVRLARGVVDTQRAEIETMTALLEG